MKNQLLYGIGLGYVIGRWIEKKNPRYGKLYFTCMGVLFWLTIGLLIWDMFIPSINLFSVIYHEISNMYPVYDNFQASRQSIIILISIIIVYVGFSFPAGYLFKLFHRKLNVNKPNLKTKVHSTMLSWRKKAPKDAYFAGMNAEDGLPIYISDADRMEHSQIVGVTGSGKTESSIIPPLIHDIAIGRGSLVIDMKGDRGLLDKIRVAMIAAGRENDLLLFCLSQPESSHTYNPLKRGNASEIKDKLISANIWSEVYYKKTSEIALLSICKAMRELKIDITFKSLLSYLSSVDNIKILNKQLRILNSRHSLDELISTLDGKVRDLTGLISDISALVYSDFGYLLDMENGEIDLLDAYLNNKIIVFQLNTGLYQETAVRLSRVIIQDLKSVSNYIQSYLYANQRSFFSVYIDEFASIAFDSFVELINKARSSQMAISISHQSLGDLSVVSNEFQDQIFDNTNTRLVYRQNSAGSRDLISKMAGTIEEEKFTYQTENFLDYQLNTGVGSARKVDTFRLDPNRISEFQTGYCALLQHKKNGSNRLQYMASDFYNLVIPSMFSLPVRCDVNQKAVIINDECVEKKEEIDLDPLKRYMEILS